MSGPADSLLALAKAPRTRLALASSLGALTVVFGVGLMASAGYLISRAAQRPAVLSLMVTIVAVQFFGLGRPVARYLERITSHDLALRVLGGVRRRAYERIEPLAPVQLDGYRKGDLLSRMVADVDALQNLYLRGVQPPLVALLAGGVSVGAALAVLPPAGIVLAAGLLVDAMAVPALSGWLGARAGRRQASGRGALAAELVEVSRGTPELVAFGHEDVALRRVRMADARLVAVARRNALAAGLGDGLGLVVTGVTVAAVLALALSASADGGLDKLLIAALALLSLASFEAVTPLATSARELPATLAAGRRILELTDQRSPVRDPAHPAVPPAWPFALALEGVTARYPGQRGRVLDRMSVRLEPGERVALTGPSGAGKTTVVNLLLRFLDPEEGVVTLGGHDLRDLRQEDVRGAIALAGQDSHLFSASIGDNVRLARPDAGDAALRQALALARIWDWIDSLPEGLDTRVGEEGRELSGGQRQRIVLARALLADASVLVLDEPTAHLDAGTATELIRDIMSAAGEKTVLLITHRPEGLDLVDRVISL
ncbi:MAG TPA: thiol reductant ABC exporter subunit CydC [Solirubrobacteraceae bacterium]|nr:thiol reductant ABC exporter subunit CydC [Solirubrobacteraceae bacterium]